MDVALERLEGTELCSEELDIDRYDRESLASPRVEAGLAGTRHE